MCSDHKLNPSVLKDEGKHFPNTLIQTLNSNLLPKRPFTSKFGIIHYHSGYRYLQIVFAKEVPVISKIDPNFLAVPPSYK